MKRQITLLGLARISGALVQTVALIALARLAGARDFGTVGTGVATFGVLSTVAGLGLGPYMAREYALGNFDAVRGASRLNLVTTGVAAGLGLGASFAIGGSPARTTAMMLLSLGIALERMTETLLSVSIASGKTSQVLASIAIRQSSLIATFVGLTLATENPVLGYCVGRLVSGIAGQMHVRLVAPYRPSSVATSIRATFKDVRHLASANTASAVRGLDVPAVSIAASSVEVGYYSAAIRVAAPLALISSTLTSVLMPRAASSSPAFTRTVFRWTVLWWLSSTVAIAAGAAPVVDQFVLMVFGEEFVRAAGAVYWVLVGIPSLLAAPILATLLQARHDDGYVARSSVLFTAVLLPAIGFGAQIGGAATAAMATAVLTAVRVIELSARLATRPG